MRHSNKISLDNEPMSSLTHLVGFGLAIAGLVLMVIAAAKHGTAWHIVSFSIFGSSLILLYLASTIYHLVPKSNRFKRLFQNIDKSFIFFLIAGTYTPIVLVPLKGAWGWSLFGIIWGLSILGIVLQIFWHKPKIWFMTTLFIFLGWLIVAILPILLNSLTKGGFSWLLYGGLSYTAGVIFFSLDKLIPNYRWFGMHEIFHIFVLAGSFCHFWLMYHYISFT